jgi:hypothetical protein
LWKDYRILPVLTVFGNVPMTKNVNAKGFCIRELNPERYRTAIFRAVPVDLRKSYAFPSGAPRFAAVPPILAIKQTGETLLSKTNRVKFGNLRHMQKVTSDPESWHIARRILMLC